jgi:hypothetical protein
MPSGKPSAFPLDGWPFIKSSDEFDADIMYEKPCNHSKRELKPAPQENYPGEEKKAPNGRCDNAAARGFFFLPALLLLGGVFSGLRGWAFVGCGFLEKCILPGSRDDGAVDYAEGAFVALFVFPA